MADKKSLVVAESIETKILTIRGQKVMLDADLAELYGVETGALNRAVKRNSERFPEDFMFQLAASEFEALRCQNGISNLRSQIGISNSPAGRGGRRYLPYVFTEHGAIMAAVVRAFVRLRELVPATGNWCKSSTSWNARSARMTRLLPKSLLPSVS